MARPTKNVTRARFIVTRRVSEGLRLERVPRISAHSPRISAHSPSLTRRVTMVHFESYGFIASEKWYARGCRPAVLAELAARDP